MVQFTLVRQSDPTVAVVVPTAVTSGGESSTTITSNVQIADSPESVLAVYVTLVVPTSKTLPDGLSTTNVAVPQLSETVGDGHVTTAWQELFALTVLLSGQPDIIGGELSITFTLKEHVAVFPARSVAV